MEVLVVRPRHEVIVAAGHDLGRRGDRRQQVAQHRVLLGVVPHEPRRLGEPSEVVGADVVLVDLGLAGARGGGLDGVADVGPSIEPAHDVQARRFDDVLERAARFDREADCAAADGQARDALRSLRGKEQRCGRADVRADDVRSAQTPLVDQAGQERSRGVRGDQFRATIGVAESRQVDGDHPPDCRDAVPDATEGPEALGPRRQQQHGDVRVRLVVGEPHSHPVADSEVGSDRRNRLGAHLTVSSFSPFIGCLARRAGRAAARVLRPRCWLGCVKRLIKGDSPRARCVTQLTAGTLRSC